MAEETVLVIEDNELNMELVESLLQLGGCQVLEATDAEAGIEMARKHKPDLILMDIQLPGLDGLTATQVIRNDQELKDIPVVALTSYAMEGDEQKAMNAGCDGYITKPIDTENFLKSLSQFFTNGRSKKRPRNNRFHRPKVLIVDDEPLNIELLSGKLPKDKYEIFEAYNGEDALGRVKEISPDLVLLDIMMPGMDGYEVTRRLKNDANTAHIPIILVTALDAPEHKAKGMEAGAEEFLTKPVHEAELLARINSMLRLSQYQEQLSIRLKSDEHFECKIPQEERPYKETRKLQRVLLVEDEEKDAELIHSYLDGQHYDIILARSGEEALSLVFKEKIDLILLDILLPGIDGFEVCRRLKEMDETKDIQIVVITSLADLDSKIKGVEKGADDFLVKPIVSREIRARVKVLLKKKAYLDQLHSHYEMVLNSAITDGLTRCYNHAYLKRFLELEIKRSMRQSYPIALIMVDLDNFKIYNDTLGHMAGDIILLELAQVIKKNIREIDMVARYGGDEFAVVMPYVDREEALTITERILKGISSHVFTKITASPLEKITASLGVAFCPSDASTTKDLVQKADANLYQAKKEGKNRACISDKGVEDQPCQNIAI